jgi:hypothetical protein
MSGNLCTLGVEITSLGTPCFGLTRATSGFFASAIVSKLVKSEDFRL